MWRSSGTMKNMKQVTPKILVIDDDPRLRDLLVRYLTEQGFQVQALADARDLDKKLQRDPPHLLVLDLMLPGEDGLAVCRRLRGAGEMVPVIMLTAREFGLLKVLATHPRQPLAREKLMLLARGRDHDVFDRAIDVQVSRLRKLIEPDPSAPRYIQTVWGCGYVFVPDEVTTEAPATDATGS